jgi:ABC-type phosphate transport system substrate-binding protein
MNQVHVGARLGCCLALAGVIGLAACDGTKNERKKIVLVSRQNNSGTYLYFREAVLGKERDFRAGTSDQNGSKDVVDLVSRTPNAIGYSGMGYATSGVKMLKVSAKGGEAIAPTVDNARTGKYPIARPLFIYTIGAPEGAVKAYLDWMLSKEGQDIVASEGEVPNTTMVDNPGAPPAEKFQIKVGGSDTMVNIAQSWAEAFQKKYPQISIQVAGGGSSTGVSGLQDGTIQIANMSRAMKPGEKATLAAKYGKDPVEFIMGQDGLAVYVHKDNPIETISIEELAEVYGTDGKLEFWDQLAGWPKSTE